MKKIIIGVHGIHNKPRPDIYRAWWKHAILDGLAGIGRPRLSIPFDLAIWSDLMYPMPQNLSEHNPASTLFIPEPYVPIKKVRYQYSKTRVVPFEHIIDQMRRAVLGTAASINVESISDLLIHTFFVELSQYYHDSCEQEDGSMIPLRMLIRQRLAKLLFQYRNRQILLIAHSLGALIALEVLANEARDVPVHTLLTVGSPVAIAPIAQKLAAECGVQSLGAIATPASVTHAWYNVYDPSDVLAMGQNASERFRPNERGVRVVDTYVKNRYAYGGRRNHHKAYGYLQTKGIAYIIHTFLSPGKESLFSQLTSRAYRTALRLAGAT